MNNKQKHRFINLNELTLKDKLWMTGAVTIIGGDVITTKIALESGVALEANPVINATLNPSNMIELTIGKTIMFLVVFLAWKYYPLKDNKINRIMDFLIPAYAAVIGTLITLWNSIMIYIIYT